MGGVLALEVGLGWGPSVKAASLPPFASSRCGIVADGEASRG